MDIRGTIHDFLSSLEDWAAGVTVLEWALLAIACSALTYVFLRIRAATTLGPIDIAKVDCDDKETTEIDLGGLTARLRERFYDVGFRPPPDVPAGAPSGGLLAAIEESPIPQANWIATLLQVFPRPHPVSYRLETTVARDGSSVSFWLRPSGDGLPLLTTIGGGVERAFEELPKQVLQHVSNDAPDVFPSWARWNDQKAVTAYLEGIKSTMDRKYEAAQKAYRRAIKDAPENSILRLRLLNVEELLIPEGDVGRRAKVLRGYLDLVMMRPELVEARFRSSALAGVLADAVARDTTQDVAKAVSCALAVDEQDLQARLRRINCLGLRQARSLLQPWFVPLLWHRPRMYGELVGTERRQLRKTLQVSSCCSFARRHRLAKASPYAPKLLWCKAVVKWQAGRSDAYWQVCYNAACFHALLGETESAWRYVDRALDSGDFGLAPSYIGKDPDLAPLREETARWKELVTRSPTGINQRPRRAVYELSATLLPPVASLLAVGVVIAAIAWPWLALGIALVVLGWHLWIVVAYLHRLNVLYTDQERKANLKSGDPQAAGVPVKLDPSGAAGEPA